MIVLCDFSIRFLFTPGFFFFFFNDTATTEIYTLSLHDALPIFPPWDSPCAGDVLPSRPARGCDASRDDPRRDRKSTRLNSSHGYISYAVFCLKKKKNKIRYRDMSRYHIIRIAADVARCPHKTSV